MSTGVTRGAVSGWTETRPSKGRYRGLDLRELWAHREVALYLALRELRVRYKQTALGVAWIVVQSLAGLAVFSAVFGSVVELPSDGLPYPVFVYSGLVLWTYFSTSVAAATGSLVENRELVTKVYFPRLLLPLSAVLPRLIDLAVSLAIAAVLIAAYGVEASLGLLLLPVWVVATMAVALAAGLWLSAVNVRYRDVGHAIGLVIQLWLFISPVVYPSSAVDGAWRWLYAANPMSGLLDGWRWSLVGAPAPGVEDLVSLLIGVALLASGILYFQSTERRMADVI